MRLSPAGSPAGSPLGSTRHVSLCLAAALLASACGGAPTPETAANAAVAIPDGPVDYGFGDTADAGFAKATIRTQPCGSGLTGIAVRVVNTSKKPMPMYQVEAAGLAKPGDVLEPQRLPYDSPCGKDGYVREIAPGEAGTLWFAFDARVAVAKIELQEPDGLAKHVARFHLDEEHRDVAVVAAARPPAPTGALAVKESQYYRVAIVGLKACRDGDRAFVAYEVLAQSFTNVELDVFASEVVDAHGTHVRPDFAPISRCFEVLPKPGRLEQLPPRGKVRAWLFPFTVPPARVDLTLAVDVTGGGLHHDELALRPGAPRKWETPPESYEVQRAKQQAKMDAALEHLRNPPPAGPPQFRDLPPIPKDAAQYHAAKMKHLVRDNHVSRDNHFLSAVPITPVLYAAGMYPTWAEKRYDEPAMRKLVGEFATRLQTELRVQMPIVHHGSVMGNGGEHSITLPDDLAEYVFLEVDGEKAIRAREAIVPLMGRVVGPFSPQTTVELVFDMPPGLTDRIMKGTGEMRIVAGGLGFKDKTVRYRLPLADVTKDAPAEIKRLVP